MNNILAILIAMFCVYGLYAALCEVRKILRRSVKRGAKQIDKTEEKEYNNTHTD